MCSHIGSIHYQKTSFIKCNNIFKNYKWHVRKMQCNHSQYPWKNSYAIQITIFSYVLKFKFFISYFLNADILMKLATIE